MHIQAKSRELQRLHDTANQHLRTLKAMGGEPSGLVMGSILVIRFQDDNCRFDNRNRSISYTNVYRLDNKIDHGNNAHAHYGTHARQRN